MNLLSEIIRRLNQRIGVANIFDKQFGLCELNANGNDKAWIHYIGDGQGEVVTNFDAKQGTIFWAKRGKVNISIIDSLKVSGCKKMYQTTFPLTAYAIVRKSHLPCDSEDAQDWIASRVYKLTSGMDFGFKASIGVTSYEVIPNGYANEIKSLSKNYEWACVSIDIDVQIVSSADDGCYDTCQTGEIPLPPNYEPCTPCLTEVAVDGVTITGNGTEAYPLVAIGGGGGTPLITKDEGTNVSTNTSTLNFTGAGVTASLTSPGVVEVNVPGGSGVTSVGGIAPIASSGGATPDISITQASTSVDGYLSSTDWNTFDGKFDVPTGAASDYLDGTGTPTPFPTLPTGTVTSVDLTMPVAFNVTGNPVTISGTLAVTAAGVATQYIRGDGQLANFPTSSGGGASVNYYLNGSVSQGTFGGVAMREINKVPVIGAGTDFTINADGYIQSFITDANDPNQLEIPAGNWTFETYFSASSSGGNPKFYIELYKWDGATLTLIASNSTNPENITGGTAIDLYLTALAVPQTTLAATDRLAVRFYVIHSGRTITMHTEDNHLSQIITTFSTGLTSLNGLTAQTQLLAVGTAGTDFAINSTTATHTFNLPTASAANRGALSSADWTTFNGKFNTPSGTTSEYVRGDGSLATFPALPVIYKSAADSASFSSTANTVVYTQLINANTFAAGDIIRVSYRTRKTGAAGFMSLRIYVNSTADLTGTPILIGALVNAGAASSLFAQMLRHLVIKNASNNTETFNAGFQGSPTDINYLQSALGNSINWTLARYFVFALQNSSAADTNFGSMYLIEKL